MQSTKAMRDRVRELSRPDQCDYDRAVVALLDDLNAYRKAMLDCQTLTPSLLTGEQAIERLKEINVHVYQVIGR